MDKLAVNVEAVGQIIGIKENESNFQNRVGQGEIMYCHNVAIEVESGFHIHAQVCTAENFLANVEVGDNIKFKVTAYSVKHERHTIKILSVFENTRKTNQSSQPATTSPSPTVRHNMIIGTEVEVAMRYSIQYYEARPEDKENTIFTKADEILQWLIKKRTT